MVFESMVTEVLNRVLGDFIENLDSKQLKLGIWGGNVVLNDLLMKSTALKDLDLPIQIVYGRLGKLTLKIPWKNLYGAPVEATIEGLYLLVVPNQQVKYDPVKDEQNQFQAKLAELAKIEDAKKKAAEKGKAKPNDTFVEKLTTQIIKNVQVKINNIHVRYEDSITHASNPFACGLTLRDLSLISTDESWTPAIVQDVLAKIFKVVNLEGLAVYWNCNAPMFSESNPADWINLFNKDIASKDHLPESYRYLLGPINSSARLRLNPKPDCDEPAYTIPKVHLNLNMEKLFIGVSKTQYRDLIALVDSMSRMSKAAPYRKFRPNVSEYKGHYKEWWHFAYDCVLEDVRRRNRNFNWEHIAKHRALCKEYAEVYQTKLTSKKLSAEIAATIERCEKGLDVTNIVIIRQKVELEVARLGKLEEEAPKKSWFSGWWGGGSAEEETKSESADIMKKFEDAMTPDEKKKLYSAIGYQENTAPVEYPEEFVDNSCIFVLQALEIQLRDDADIVPVVLNMKLLGVKCLVNTRAAASALKAAVNIDEMLVTGLQRDSEIPTLVLSHTQSETALLDVLFEKNPLDKLCDQRVHLTSKPLKVIYDAGTINKVIDIFNIPDSSAIDELSAAAEQRLSNIKQMSAIGLQHAIEKRDILDLRLDLQAPYIIVPYEGVYTGNETVLVVNLGSLKISTQPTPRANVRSLHAKGTSDQDIFDEMIKNSYDQFILEFSNLQIVLAQSGEDWLSCITQSVESSLHILKPISLKIVFFKGLITDDPRLPLAKIEGELPSINVELTDTRLLTLLALALSIPLPEPVEQEPKLEEPKTTTTTTSVISKNLELFGKSMDDYLKSDQTDEIVQFTTIQAKFVMQEISVTVIHETEVNNANKLVNFRMNFLEFDFTQQTFNMKASVRLGGIQCVQFREEDVIKIINPRKEASRGVNLFTVEFIQVNKKSPEFHTLHNSCEAKLILEFASLDVVLHQEGLLTLMKFANEFQSNLTDLIDSSKRHTPRQRLQRLSSVASNQLSIASATISAAANAELRKHTQQKDVLIDTIQFKLVANLEQLSVLFKDNHRDISQCAVKGVSSEIIIKKTYTQITTHLLDLCVWDLNPNTAHPKILYVSSDQALNTQIVLYNSEYLTDSPSSVDISVKATLGCMRVSFLNLFVSNMLAFLNNFQQAQDSIKEASQAAALSARENMQNAYEKCTKISLNINMKAPIIFVPVSVKSTEAFMLDLGNLSLSNTFSMISVPNQDNSNAVVDEMNLLLSNLTLSRVTIKDDKLTDTEHTIIEPITFSIWLKRNLSASWYKAIPDVDASGKIDSIVIQLSQTDYQAAMKVLSGNLAEGTENPAPPPPTRPKIERADVRIESKTQDNVVSTEEKVHTMVKFAFTLESLIVKLYDKNISSQDNLLTLFKLEVVSIKGRILSDNSIALSFLLVNCLLEDTRVNRKSKLKKMLERKQKSIDEDMVPKPGSSEALSPSKSMLDVTVQIKNKDMFVDVRVYSFMLIVSMEYINMLKDFFTSLPGMESSAESSQLVKSNAVELGADQRRTTQIQTSIEKQEQGTLTLNLRIEQPDIILVKDMDRMDTEAIILNTEVLLKVRMSGQHQVISGSVKDIHLYTCCYDPSKREETQAAIIHPFSISLAGSTPEGKGLHLEVCITAIQLSVSPATVELLNGIMRTLTTGGSAQEVDGDALEDFSHIWNYKKTSELDHWFLRPDVAEEAHEMPQIESASPTVAVGLQKLKEMCIVTLPSLVVTVEAGFANKTVPLLLLETTFQGKVCDWSSQLTMEASLSMQMGYYNSHLALWEPLIEPVEIVKNNKPTFVPWELKVEIFKNEIEDPQGSIDEEEVIHPSAMNIEISSSSNLELTLTKSCLDVLNNLAKAFTNAIKEDQLKKPEIIAPYQVINNSGFNVTLFLNESAFQVFGNLKPLEVVLDNGAHVALELKPDLVSKKAVQLNDYGENSNAVSVQSNLFLEINELNCKLQLPIVRADQRYFPLNYRGDGNNWGLVSDIAMEGGSMIATLRSIVKVYNHLDCPVDVYYMTNKGDELECIRAVEAGGFLNIPIRSVYTPTSELFFSISGYSVTKTPVIWKDLQLQLNFEKTLECCSNSPDCKDSFIMKVTGEIVQIYHENTIRHTMISSCYNIHLYPTVILKNCLPLQVTCIVEGTIEEKSVNPGENLRLCNVKPGESNVIIKIRDYLEKLWSCSVKVEEDIPEFSVWQFDSHDSLAKMTLHLGLHVLRQHGSLVMSLYCPFWMINKTNLRLCYRNAEDALNILNHPADYKDPILFSFNTKNFFGKKKMCIKVGQGEWSDKFSIDAAGSSGVVNAKEHGTTYQIGVSNRISYNGLTKQVSFTPYYVIINNAPFAIECQELHRPADPWTPIDPKSCAPLWPKAEGPSNLLRLRIAGTEDMSAPFLYDEPHTSLLKLPNQYGGINVDIRVTEGGVYIDMIPYEHGQASALIINRTQSTISLWEKETVQIRELEPDNQLLFTWQNPSGCRKLVWVGGKSKEIEDDLRVDNAGHFLLNDSSEIYYVSFLDGLQRTLLFTTDEVIANNVQSAKEFESCNQEIMVSLHGVGISLVNNQLRKEIMYIGIASSGVIWETCKLNCKKYKQLGPKESTRVEEVFQKYLLQIQAGEGPSTVKVDSKTEIDFASNLILKPSKKKLRRTFQTGVWLSMRSSDSQLQLHAKINRLQIDNQTLDCIFPVVLAPVPPPKSIAATSGIKPFAEVSIVRRLTHAQIVQFKYFKVLIQEFHIKVDLEFINDLMELLQNDEYNDENEKEKFKMDRDVADAPLYDIVSTQSSQEVKNFYDLLHFSPLKIHISFSIQSGLTLQQAPTFINVLLQSLGVTLTNLQDVVFKLAFFERQYAFLTQKQLTSEVIYHYTGQAVKQLYVLVLGLDVIGNPYGLVIGVAQGVEDFFYEPFQGAIQGPGEFAEGLVLGMRSLLGHTVGGAAGAVSRITGAMGKGIAALTFDEDYQRKRRDQANQRPSTVHAGLAQGGKGLVMGVVGGITGLFTKPVSGAKEQGVGGFFKGLGKGAIGLITRPAAGVIDFAGGTMDTVKRATELHEETGRLRSPRFLPKDGLVKPYNSWEAEGNKLLNEMDKGKYASTDFYAAHFFIIPKKEVLLLTDRRLAYVVHNDLFGGWQVEWGYTWQDIPNPPMLVPKGISITVSDNKKKVFSQEPGKLILVDNPDVQVQICTKIEEVRGNA